MFCNIGWHNWGKWSNPEEMWMRLTSLILNYEGKPHIGLQQHRTCKRCGKYKERLIA